MGRLTTYVLDAAAGTPGQNLAIALFEIVGSQRQPIKSVRTNHDGRCDVPLLGGDALQTGVYELDFSVSEYYRAAGVKLPEPAFLDVVTLRFGVAGTSMHCHVPLLVSPWPCSTYRDS